MPPLSIIIMSHPPLPPIYNPIIIPPLSYLCISPPSLICRLSEMQTIVAPGERSGACRGAFEPLELKSSEGGRKRSESQENYEKITSKKMKENSLTAQFCLTWNSVDLLRKYTRRAQDGRKRPIQCPRPVLCLRLPSPSFFQLFFAHLSDFNIPMTKMSKSERWAKLLP